MKGILKRYSIVLLVGFLVVSAIALVVWASCPPEYPQCGPCRSGCDCAYTPNCGSDCCTGGAKCCDGACTSSLCGSSCPCTSGQKCCDGACTSNLCGSSCPCTSGQKCCDGECKTPCGSSCPCTSGQECCEGNCAIPCNCSVSVTCPSACTECGCMSGGACGAGNYHKEIQNYAWYPECASGTGDACDAREFFGCIALDAYVDADCSYQLAIYCLIGHEGCSVSQT